MTLRLPDHVRDAEASLLSAMLRFPECVAEVTRHVTAADFGTAAHRDVFAALAHLWSTHGKLDLVSLADHLHKAGEIANVGGYGYIADLYARAPSSGHALRDAKVVREASLRRGVHALARRLAQECESPTGEIVAAVRAAQDELFALTEAGADDAAAWPSGRTVGLVYDRLDSYAGRKGGSRTLATGFLGLDELVTGLEKGSLTLIAARPGQGKTSLGLCLARNMALDQGAAVLFASLEMGKGELMERLLCTEARVDSRKARQNRLAQEEYDRLLEAGRRVAASALWVRDRADSVLDVVAEARRLQGAGRLDAVFVDYVQLIPGIPRKGKSASRYEVVGDTSQRLKHLARNLDVPVVAMAQLNRDLENRTNQRPRLSDLRESGNLEQDADTVLLLYHSGESENLTELIVAKQRNGPTGDLLLRFDRQLTLFSDFTPPPPERSSP